MMPTSEVFGMINQALGAMIVGVSGVFAVLAVFYISVKVLMVTNISIFPDEDGDDDDD